MAAADSFVGAHLNLSPWKEALVEIEVLKAECDALRRDAERYRWLRTKGALRREAHIAVLTKNGGFVGEEEVVDAVIDAALAKPWEGAEHGEGRQRC